MYEKLNQGDPVTKISRTVYNDTIDMLRWWKARFRTGGPGTAREADLNHGVFSCKNATGADQGEYAVVGLDGPMLTPTENLDEFKNRTPLKGILPNVAAHAGKWGVFLNAIATNGISPLCASGVAPVRVYVTATTDKFCDVIEKRTVAGEDCYLGTGGSGEQLMWLDPTASVSTIAWAIVRIGGGGGGLTCRILYDDVAPGDSDKNAWPVKVESGSIVADTAAEKVLLQNVFHGTFRGYGSNHSGFSTTTAAKVWTMKGPDGKEHIVVGKGLAKRCHCQLNASLAATDSSATVKNVAPTDGGQSPVASGTLTVTNMRNPSGGGGFAGAVDTYCCIEHMEGSGAGSWYIYDMPCAS